MPVYNCIHIENEVLGLSSNLGLKEILQKDFLTQPPKCVSIPESKKSLQTDVKLSNIAKAEWTAHQHDVSKCPDGLVHIFIVSRLDRKP